MFNSTAMDRTIESYRNPINTLELACRMIDKQITADSSTPTLVDLATMNCQSGATASGLTDCDYPTLSGLAKGCANLNQLKIINKVSLPPEVMEHFGHMQCHCTMGLFTEINRAWLTIDSDIYVWTYEHGSDVAYFDGLGETIISVGLVKPKQGVFHQFIKYLMILTTTVEIVVLGVTFTVNADQSPLGPQEEINLVPEPIFVIPTDGIAITTIVGTKLGRIFMGGRDGSLFEIAYQAEGSWFGKRCKKVNHSTGTLSFLVPSFLNVAFSDDDPILKISVDNSRNILYTLTEKGSIEVYDMGESGMGISRVTRVTQASVVQSALNIVKTLDSANFRPIVSISALEVSDSPLQHLVAVTQTGVRFYFTTINIIQPSPNQRPYRLELVHVRLPPGFSANAPALRPKMINLANYRRNSLMMIASPTPDQNHLWCLSSDQFPFLPLLMEAYTVLSLDGPAWAMEEVLFNEDITPSIPSNRDKTSLHGDPPLAVRQHSEPARKFVILTAQGAHIVSKLRPVDLLRQLLVDSNGPDGDAIRAYFQIQREDQACATCLILACLESVQNMQLSEWATRAFFMYGGEPKVMNTITSTNLQNLVGFNPTSVSTPMPVQRPAGSILRTPLDSTNPTMLHHTLQQSHFQTVGQSSDSFGGHMSFSPKHDGLYLYVGRILRPLWNVYACQKFVQDSKEYLIHTVNGEDCIWILDYLQSLRSFLDKNTQLAINSNLNSTQITIRRPMNDSNMGSSPQSGIIANRLTALQDAQLEERQSLDALKTFVGHACEVLGLWKILCEHQFHLIADAISKDYQNMLLNATFKDIFVHGHEILSHLIISLINNYLNDNASVDSISNKLRKVCPNLYRNEDAACSKANEILLVSKKKQNIHEKEEMLMSALNLCKDVAPNLNLGVVCQKFLANQFYQGVLDLCVTCARKADDKNVGLHFYKSNEPADDQDGIQAYARRMECYKEVAHMLDMLKEQSVGSIENGTPPNAEATQLLQQVIQDALRYDDELLHVSIYDWMLSNNMHSELITIPEPTLEQYLIRTSQQRSDATHVYDLLWKYYERNKNHPAAAKVLNALATESGDSVNLSQRIEYLAHSVMCMRSDKVGYAAPLGVFLRELEDRIQIARVQQKILDALINTCSNHPRVEEAIRGLNSKLLDNTDLYGQYADPFGLWECKLAIIHCSGHDDAALIRNIWENIIASEVRSCRGTNEDKAIQLLNKVKALGREYGESEHCFPLRIIVNLLEVQCCKLMVHPSQVPSTLISMNIPYNRLIDTYKSLLKERIAGNVGNEFHMFEAVAHLLMSFTENPHSVSHVERLMVITKAQEVVSSALSSLYSKPNTEGLIHVLRNIQAKLDRLQ